MRNLILTLVTLGLNWGCATSAQTEAPAQATPAPVPAPASWKEAHSKDQKVAFMREKVVPSMGPVFQAYDAKGFAEFGCATCHGPEFKSPKQFLPSLTFKDGKFEECAEDAKMCQFMGEKVLPTMAQTMGEEPYNPETHKGFGCGDCHALIMQ